jgi:dienelactone hydrolase
MGLVWSMHPAGPPDPRAAREPLAPQHLGLAAQAGGTTQATAEVTRLLVPDGLTRTQVRERGLAGVLYRPAGNRPLPAVLMLGGAEGGLHEDAAALLAAHGYIALALAYHAMPGLPQTLTNIPVEYFGTALSYLSDRAGIAAGQIAVHGVSKGGEAALLIGSIYPAIRAVISIAGGGLVTQGISQDAGTGSLLEILRTPVPNWTWQGRELPYLPNVVTPRIEAAAAGGGPASPGWAAPDLSHPGKVAEAANAVERIAGPVLLTSGADDQTYGPAFQEAAAQRLARRQAPASVPAHRARRSRAPDRLHRIPPDHTINLPRTRRALPVRRHASSRRRRPPRHLARNPAIPRPGTALLTRPLADASADLR